MEAVAFRQMLKQRDVTFFSGVPDSTFQAAIAPVEGIPRVSHAPIAIRDRFAAHIRND